jgi:hypothetical protein
MAGWYRTQGIVERFGRPYGAQGLFLWLTQGYVRCRELHPGLFLIPHSGRSSASGWARLEGNRNQFESAGLEPERRS